MKFTKTRNKTPTSGGICLLQKKARLLMQRDYRKDWTDYPIDAIPSKSKLPDFLFELLEKEKAKTILDLGCGIGKFAIELCQKGYSVVGVDINPEAIKKAKAEAQKSISNSAENYLRFYEGDATSLQLTEAPFDAVIMQLVVSIIGGKEERESLFQTAKSLIKKNGLLYLSAVGASEDINPEYAEIYRKDFGFTQEQHTYFSRDNEGKILYATHHFTRNGLEKLLSAFKEIKIREEFETTRSGKKARFLYVTAKAK